MKSWICLFLYFHHNFGYGSIPTMIRLSKDQKLKTLGLPDFFKKNSMGLGKNGKKRGSQVDPLIVVFRVNSLGMLKNGKKVSRILRSET